MSDGKPHCGCCDEINQAIQTHMGIVDEVLSTSSLNIPQKDIEEARSDAIEALWKALLVYDQTKMRLLGAFPRVRVKQRVIDGLRRRGIDVRHSLQTNMAKQAIIHAPSMDGMDPLKAEAIWTTGGEWDESDSESSDTPDRLMALAWYIDPELPVILGYTALGYTCNEIQKERPELKSVSRKLNSFKKYVELFPDLVYRPEMKWVNRQWRSQEEK